MRIIIAAAILLGSNFAFCASEQAIQSIGYSPFMQLVIGNRTFEPRRRVRLDISVVCDDSGAIVRTEGNTIGVALFKAVLQNNIQLREQRDSFEMLAGKTVERNTHLSCERERLDQEIATKEAVNRQLITQNKSLASKNAQLAKGLVEIGRLPGQSDSIYGTSEQCLGFKNFVDRSNSLERQNKLLKYMAVGTVFAGAAYLGFRAWANKKR